MEWTTVKKGWLDVKSKFLFLNIWHSKWIVLYSEPVAALAIYDQRDHAIPPYYPRYHLTLEDCRFSTFVTAKKFLVKIALKAGDRKATSP